VFESRDGSWVVVVGDVCGKGPSAAAVTGLARYTLRAGAVHERRPSGVLAMLNNALCDERSTQQLCTAAYARLDRNGSGFRLTCSVGGHPLPLLLRADGTVEHIGVHGIVLGAQADPYLADTTVEMHPADCLLMYTDGLTDAYAPAHTLAVADIESLLASCAGSSAGEIAERVSRAVLEFSRSEPRDDIALVVVRIADQPPPDDS
jgi:sigma-B regulation protein RsbU (phosphoserine phosphatase)